MIHEIDFIHHWLKPHTVKEPLTTVKTIKIESISSRSIKVKDYYLILIAQPYTNQCLRLFVRNIT